MSNIIYMKERAEYVQDYVQLSNAGFSDLDIRAFLDAVQLLKKYIEDKENEH